MTKLITVHGMIGENCRRLIITELEKIDSVKRVSITLKSRLVEVVYDDTLITLNELKKKLQLLGFEPL